jgi:hypothetical protein
MFKKYRFFPWVGLKLRFWSFIQMFYSLKMDRAMLREFRFFYLDFLIRGMLRGHAPKNFLGQIACEVTALIPGYRATDYAKASPLVVMRRAMKAVDLMVGSSARDARPYGFLRPFFDLSVSHLLSCPECRRDFAGIIKDHAAISQSCQLLSPPVQDSNMGKGEKDLMARNVMAEIARMETERKSRLRLVPPIETEDE